jgi:hypothetical protein
MSFVQRASTNWRNRANGTDGDSGDSGAPNFHDADDLTPPPNKKPRRAPFDESPDAVPQECFATEYEAQDQEDDDPALGAQDRARAFRRLKQLVDEHHGSDTQIQGLVGLIQAHYDEHIKRDYGGVSWSRDSIYRWISDWANDSEERQALEGIKLAWRQVELLRMHVADEDVATGEVTPNLKVQKALNDALKVHSSLVTDRKRRLASSGGCR